MDIKVSPNDTFILICPACRHLAFDPKVCVNCSAVIPPSTRIKILRQDSTFFEITGLRVDNFPKSAPARSESKMEISQKCETQSKSRFHHGENCVCAKYIKTDDQTKDCLSVKMDEMEEDMLYESYESLTPHVPCSSNSIKKQEVVTETPENNTSLSTKPTEKNIESMITLTSSPVKNSPAVSSILVYPNAKGIRLTNHDIACLNAGRQLNDTVIEFYLKYIFYEKIPEEFQERTHIFLTFFSSFLSGNFEKKRENIKQLDVLKGVKRWIKNVNIFSKDFIFVPINRCGHWSLAVICFLAQLNESTYGAITAASNSSEARSKASDIDNINSNIMWKDHPYLAKGKPCICFFDSLDEERELTQGNQTVARTLKEFLKMAWSCESSLLPYDLEHLLILKAHCPQQCNIWDCGLYLLQYVESFFTDPIPYFGNPMPDLSNWFSYKLMAHKREIIKKVISDLKEKQL